MTLIAIVLGLGRHFVIPAEQLLCVAGYGFWLVLVASAALVTLASRQALFARLAGIVSLCLIAGWFMAGTQLEQSDLVLREHRVYRDAHHLRRDGGGPMWVEGYERAVAEATLQLLTDMFNR